MITIIENNDLRISVDSMGAEMVSLINKRNKREYVWNGDPKWWKRHAPILFPCVGASWNQTVRVDGKDYPMSQHGFARDMEFLLSDQTSESLEYTLCDNEESRRHYPASFELKVKITLRGKRVGFRYEVSSDCAYQIGAHPAFVMPRWEENLSQLGSFGLAAGDYTMSRVGRMGCISRDLQQAHYEDIPITPHTFDNDALIFETPTPHTILLNDADGQPILSVDHDAPALGLWAPAKGEYAPFVCIEPWWGRADWEGFEGEMKDKPYCNHSSGQFEWGVTVIDNE